jgi:pilus assembly protein CpaC
MKLLIVFLMLICGSNLPAAKTQQLTKPPMLIAIKMGEQKVITKSEFRNFSFAHLTVINPKVVHVMSANGSLKLTGRAAGEASVVMSKGIIKIIVYSNKLEQPKRVIEDWLQDVSGIEIELKPKSIILSGTAYRLSDWNKLQEFKHRFSPMIQSQVKLTKNIKSELKSSVLNALREKSLTSVEVHEQNDELSLSSSTKKKDERAAINKVAEKWGLSAVESNQNIELKPMIEINIVIAEMKKNSARSLGLQLPGTYSATILPSSDLSSFATNFDALTPQFHASLLESMGKVLANPRLLCRSGEVAHFVAGGEIPIKVKSKFEVGVVWKKYGVILDITPTADLNEGISAGLVTEISLLDSAHTVEGIPGLLTNRIETHFDLRGSKTIALSGLIKSETGRDSNSIPILGEIPIIGELFKSRDFKENRTELVVFVTPKIISPEAPPPQPVLPHWADEP